MDSALWLRFDIPYSEDATLMRAVLACAAEKDNEISLITVRDCRDIRSAIKDMYDKTGKNGIIFSESFCFIFPHDARHGLAWAVKEEAGKKNAAFVRHIPNIRALPHDIDMGYEHFDTGSAEDNLEEAEAQQTVLDLNAQAMEIFTDGEMIEAMNPLRHALWMVLRYFGWCNPGTMYTVRNLGYTLNLTGNEENKDEFFYLIERILHHWRKIPPTIEMWKGAEAVIESTVDMCKSMGDETLAQSILDVTAPQRW